MFIMLVLELLSELNKSMLKYKKKKINYILCNHKFNIYQKYVVQPFRIAEVVKIPQYVKFVIMDTIWTLNLNVNVYIIFNY
jgi:hypothetical protein